VIVNNTPYAIAEAVLMDPEGREVFVAVAKATFTWGPDGELSPAASALPIAVTDVPGDPPAASGLAVAGEVTLPKPRVDVLVQGEIVLRTPVEQIDCRLEIGEELRKSVRVSGDRHWRQGAGGTMLPSRARPFVRMPIDWRRSFGGVDPDDPSCLDRRNPVGRGVRRRPGALEGHPVPNFEDPRVPIGNPADNPAPVGWGPIAPHWQSRRDLAGTYDQRWEAERFPLLPIDFDPGFLNAAPADQQLARYRPGDEVRLGNFTPRGLDRFLLPEVAPPLTVVDARVIHQVATRVDTLIIEPVERRLSLIARAVYAPRDVQALMTAFLGPLSDQQRRTLHAGTYQSPRAPRD
jgi:hypothetical protein